MNPNEYLKQYEDDNLNAFARRIGVPQPTIWRIFKGKVVASGSVATKIVQGSGGRISYEDLFIPECITGELKSQE